MPWLVEKNGFVEDGVRDGVHAPADEAHGALVALRRELSQDGDEDLVREVAEVPPRGGGDGYSHGGGFCRVDLSTDGDIKV